jgi:uncharacterized membrane protein
MEPIIQSQDESIKEKIVEFINEPESEAKEESVKPSTSAEADDSSNEEPLLPPLVKVGLFICIGLFVVGVLSSNLYLWAIAVCASLLFVAVLFVTGLVQVFLGKSDKLIGASILLFIILFLVGFGACMLNSPNI